MKETWQIELDEATQQSHMRIHGVADALTSRASYFARNIVEVYGDDKRAFLLIKPSIPKSEERPAAILFHPKTHLIVFNVRELTAKDLERGSGGELWLRRQTKATEIDLMKHINDLQIDVEGVVKKRLNRTKLRIAVHSMLVLPHITARDWHEADMVDELNDRALVFRDHLETYFSLQQRIEQLLPNLPDITDLKKSHLDDIRRAFGDNEVINEPRPSRDYLTDGILGAYLDEVYALDKALSDEQQEFSRIEVDDSPRLFRGVAGSGKSIVLANQVANYLERQRTSDMFENDSGRQVAVVCFNRSLVSMLKRKICASLNQKDLPDEITVSHFNGLLYQLSTRTSIRYLSIADEDNQQKRARYFLDQIKYLKNADDGQYRSVLFDAIFVDEGQDFLPEEYQLLLELIKPGRGGQKPLIVFYDDAQNLYARAKPNWKQLGLDVTGGRSRVMRQCHRNTIPVVELAFNVLLGTHSQSKNVATRTFADVAYLKQNALIQEDEERNLTRVNFAKRRGPNPKIRAFADRDQEKLWIAKEAIRLINIEKVRPEDILILFDRIDSYSDLASLISELDNQSSIQGYIHPYGGKTDRDQYIFQPDHLTISTIHGAKGYDAMVVFLVGVDQFSEAEQDRAAFYVGATRSKFALYLSGVERESGLLNEANAVLKCIAEATVVSDDRQ